MIDTRIAEPDHVLYVLRNMRDDDQKEWFYSAGHKACADDVVEIFNQDGFTYCGYHDDTPIVAGGINMENPYVHIGWAVATSLFASYTKSITRQCRDIMKRERKAGIPVIANSWDGHPGSAKWLEMIGFEKAFTHELGGQPFTVFELQDGK